MKLLVFSDVHCSEKYCSNLLSQSEAADVVVGAGDFASVRRGLCIAITILRKITKPTVLVPGNNETREELESACKGWASAHVLHGAGMEISGQLFYGVGGGVPVTPFGSWSYDFTEEQARRLLKACPDASVLVTHSPPRGAVDISSAGQSLGSEAIREAIFHKAPALVVCGHIHGSAGKNARLGRSTVINAGPEGIIWEL